MARDETRLAGEPTPPSFPDPRPRSQAPARAVAEPSVYRTSPPKLESVTELLAAEKYQDAATRLSEAYRAASSEKTLPSPRITIDLILRLYEDHAAASAERLRLATQHWIYSAKDEEARLSDQDRDVWESVQALSQLPATFPSAARAAMAYGIRSGHVTEAQARLAKVGLGRADLTFLRQRLPVLAHSFAREMAPTATVRRSFFTPVKGATAMGSLVMMLWVLRIGLRGLSSLLMPTPPARAVDPVPIATAQPQPAASTSSSRSFAVRAAPANEGDWALMDGYLYMTKTLADADTSESAATAVSTLRLAIRHRDCNESRRALTELRSVIRADSPAVINAFKVLGDNLAFVCR